MVSQRVGARDPEYHPITFDECGRTRTSIIAADDYAVKDSRLNEIHCWEWTRMAMSRGTRIELICVPAGSVAPYRTHRCLVPANPRDTDTQCSLWMSNPADVEVHRSEADEFFLARVHFHPPNWEPDG